MEGRKDGRKYPNTLESSDAEEKLWLLDIQREPSLYEEAVALVIRTGRGSISMLQRELSIGYGRACRLIDSMAGDKIISKVYVHALGYEVLYTWEQWEARKNGGDHMEVT